MDLSNTFQSGSSESYSAYNEADKLIRTDSLTTPASCQSIESIFDLDSVIKQLISFRKFRVLNDSITSNGKIVIALQFPDDYLWASKELVSKLKKTLLDLSENHEEEFSLFVLADTQYSACCADEIAAEHVNADVIVHFGQACLSKTNRIPVIFAFEAHSLNTDTLNSEIQNAEEPILLIYDVCHAHLHWDSFRRSGRVEVASVSRATNLNGIHEYTRTFPTDFSPSTVIFVGPDSPGVNRFSCIYSQCKVLHYNSTTDHCASPLSLYKKRYYMMQKAKEAQTIGIVVGTLGVSNYLDLIHSLKTVIRKQGKKCYTFALGKLNVPKLANFSEIDVFVLIACPESTIIDSKEFFRPVVTPFEMIMALKSGTEWNGTYEFHFQSLLAHLKNIELLLEECASSETEEDQGSKLSTSSALAIRQVGEIALKRTWRGLELHSNSEKSMELVQGRHGIASQYQDEPHFETNSSV